MKSERDSGDKLSWLLGNKICINKLQLYFFTYFFCKLGDSGYALEPWMMTPYRSAQEGSRESKFNQIHAKCRNIIERCIGVLKGRFRCLRALHYAPEKAAQIINVCCMLHNVCIKYNSSFDENVFYVDKNKSISQNVINNEPANNINLTAEAKKIRDNLRNAF